MIRFNPSNSSNRMGGGGSLGESRITEDSTWGGGRKFPTGLAMYERREEIDAASLGVASALSFSWIGESDGM